MRRSTLAPPQSLSRIAVLDVASPLATGWSGGPAGSGESVARDRLGRPAPARESRRHLFRPRRGWFRALERRISNLLSAHLYPWIPGMRLPYDRLLRRSLTLSEAEVGIAQLPRAFAGTKILLVTDPHAGPFVSPRALDHAMRRLMACEPDLVLLGGDLTTARIADFEESREVFRALRAPLGVFAVLGNHDHYTGDPDRLRRLVERSGVHLLHNRSVELKRDGQRLTLAGVDDLLVGAPDLDAALRDRTGPVVLLSHNPDLLFDAARRGVSLVLSGHTHAGQIRIPGLPVLVRQSRYRLDGGRYRVDETQLIVSRGLGAVGIPWRFACPPEGVLVTLRRSPA